jgi:DNA end-binding protein Ku
MAARPTWKGYLKISLVSIPVRVFPATDSAATVSFNGAISLTGYYDNLERASPKTYQKIRSCFSPLERTFSNWK